MSSLTPTGERLPATNRQDRGIAPRGSPIRHIVVIVQENRSVDNLFQRLRGANTQPFGYDSGGKLVRLQSEDLAAPFDPAHAHDSWVADYNGGAMNGFNKEGCKGSCPRDPSYSFVPQSEVLPYFEMAEKYAFADNFFQSNQGPSFPAHQYLISGTSAVSNGSPNKAAGNPVAPNGALVGGCDSPNGSLVEVINPKGGEPPSLKQFPCFERNAIMNELDAAGISWRYYQAAPGAGLWNAVDAIYSIWSNPGEIASNVVSPSSQVLADIAHDNLADVVWVTPTKLASDHPRVNDGSGPSWVASVVNAVGESPYWKSTAIFIVWDDWGGFYDHVAPHIYNSYELSFRVPMIVVSPYARNRYVSHDPHEFGSILKFIEENFDLPSLGTTDVRADDLSDCFDYAQHPTKFRKIHAKYGPLYFFRQPAAVPED